MKHRLIAIVLVLALLTALPCFVSADETELKQVVDEADLFTPDEEMILEQKAWALKSGYDMDVVILTVWSLDGKTAQEYADDYFDDNGYGVGPNYSGVLFLISMEYRDWWMSTCGDGIYALTDYGIEQIFSEMAWYLSDDEYYDAFSVYLDELATYFEAYKNGAPIDGYWGEYEGPGSYSPGTAEDIYYYESKPELADILPVSIGVGIVFGLVSVIVMISTMNTKKKQNNAVVYLKPGSYDLTVLRDLFLYSRVTKTRRSSESSGSGGRSGGGSSVHRSSSGRSHGGGGGKF